MKRLLSLLLCVTLVLCACGKQEEVITETSDPLYYIENDIYGYNVYETYVELTDFFGSPNEIVEIPEEFLDTQTKKNKPLKVIGKSAFNQDSGARYVTIPDSVVEIKSGAFRNCGGMESIKIGKNVKTIGNNAFYECTGIKELVIPDSVTNIGAFAFTRCASIVTLDLGNGLSQIGENAFEGCASLEEVKGGKELSIVGSSAFAKTPWYESLSEEFAGIEGVLLKYNGTESDIEIPGKFTSVADAFAGNTSIKSVKLPKSFKAVANNAFEGCSALQNVSIPDSVSYIGGGAFAGTPFIESLNSEDDFCVVGDGVLLKYTGDSSSLKIPDNIKFISDAFFGNETIAEVKMGEGTETIGRDAFAECPALDMVIITESVKHIDEYAFSGTEINEFYTSGNVYAKNWAKEYGLKNIIG